MRKLYSENQVKQIVIDVLKEFGIELNEDEKLEITVPIVFDENVQLLGLATLEGGSTLSAGTVDGAGNVVGIIEK